MEWRYLPFKKYNPYFKTGLNTALINNVSETGKPFVFLAGWNRRTVNIGYSQKVEEEVNLDKVEEENIALVRRQGGGGTTYLTPNGEITWHMIAPEKYFPSDLTEIYEKICGKIGEGLSNNGINAYHEPVNDIVTDQGKISGSTAKKSSGVVYTAGTLLYEVNPNEMFSVITPSQDKLKDKQVGDFRDRVTSIRQHKDWSYSETVEILKETLLTNKVYTISKLSDSVQSEAESLAEKYKSDEWIYQQ